jgi:hypothetical protein
LSIVLGKRTAHLPSGQTVALGIVGSYRPDRHPSGRRGAG